VAWAGSFWVVVGGAADNTSSILTSTDGLNWTAANANSALFSQDGVYIDITPGVGYGVAGYSQIYTTTVSPDNITTTSIDVQLKTASTINTNYVSTSLITASTINVSDSITTQSLTVSSIKTVGNFNVSSISSFSENPVPVNFYQLYYNPLTSDFYYYTGNTG
jgi:hypothetical protein